MLLSTNLLTNLYKCCNNKCQSSTVIHLLLWSQKCTKRGFSASVSSTYLLNYLNGNFCFCDKRVFVTDCWNNCKDCLSLIELGLNVLKCRESSVTRFGEMSPLWHNFKSFGQFLAFIWQNVIFTLVKCHPIGQVVFIVADSHIL